MRHRAIVVVSAMVVLVTLGFVRGRARGCPDRRGSDGVGCTGPARYLGFPHHHTVGAAGGVGRPGVPDGGRGRRPGAGGGRPECTPPGSSPERTKVADQVDTREDGTPGFYNNFWLDQGTKAIGTRRTSLIIDPPNGQIPALTPERPATGRRESGVSSGAPSRLLAGPKHIGSMPPGVQRWPTPQSSRLQPEPPDLPDAGQRRAADRDGPHGSRRASRRASTTR